MGLLTDIQEQGRRVRVKPASLQGGITLDYSELEDIGRLLKLLPKGYGWKVAIAGLRRAAKPMAQRMKSNASFSKRIQKSIGIKSTRGKKFPAVWIGVQRHLIKKHGGWFWYMHEWGTRVRRPVKKDYLSFYSLMYGRWIRVKEARGLKERPFLRPAIDATIKQVEKNVINEIRVALVRFLERHKKKFG